MNIKLYFAALINVQRERFKKNEKHEKHAWCEACWARYILLPHNVTLSPLCQCHSCNSFQLFTLFAGVVWRYLSFSSFCLQLLGPSSMEPALILDSGDRLISTFKIRRKTLLFD